jgi:hypothetical protein
MLETSNKTMKGEFVEIETYSSYKWNLKDDSCVRDDDCGKVLLSNSTYNENRSAVVFLVVNRRDFDDGGTFIVKVIASSEWNYSKTQFHNWKNKTLSHNINLFELSEEENLIIKLELDL